MKGLRAKSPLRYHLNATLEAEIWLLGLTTTLEVFRPWLVPLFVGIMNTDTHRKAIFPVVHHSRVAGKQKCLAEGQTLFKFQAYAGSLCTALLPCFRGIILNLVLSPQ